MGDAQKGYNTDDLWSLVDALSEGSYVSEATVLESCNGMGRSIPDYEFLAHSNQHMHAGELDIPIPSCQLLGCDVRECLSTTVPCKGGSVNDDKIDQIRFECVATRHQSSMNPATFAAMISSMLTGFVLICKGFLM